MYFELLRPYSVMLMSFRYIPLFLTACYFLLAVAFYLSSWVAPSDFQQGENYRILFIHVPAAWISLLIYILVTFTSILYLITKHPLFHLFTQTGSRIGALFTLLTLCSGCLWGKPMWGTFWVWDARLTSVLILFFIYLGALRFNTISADIASIFICIGFINIPIIKFSVNWWNTLHQPSSISQFGTSIHISMLTPILLMFLCFVLICLLLFCIEMRQYILHHYSFSLAKQIKTSHKSSKPACSQVDDRLTKLGEQGRRRAL
jgi:heme exporter protein CcmC